MRLLAPLLALPLLLTGCSDSPSASPRTQTPQVVTGAYPFGWLVGRVLDSRGDVEDLAKPGVEPHDVELTPREVARVRKADVVIYLKGFQPALDQAVEGLDQAVDLGRVVDQVEGEGDVRDPHVWLDPVRMQSMAVEVARALRSQGIDADADMLVATLKQLDADIRAQLQDCRTKEFVTSHTAFGYFAQRYGLVQRGISGLDPEAEPSPGKLADVVRFAKAHKVTTIFFEKLVDPSVAKTVASEVGAKTAVLDPVESVALDDDYLSVMRRNAAALHEALGCR